MIVLKVHQPMNQPRNYVEVEVDGDYIARAWVQEGISVRYSPVVKQYQVCIDGFHSSFWVDRIQKSAIYQNAKLRALEASIVAERENKEALPNIVVRL